MSETPETDSGGSFASTIDNVLTRIDPFIPMAFSMIQISPKEKIVGFFEMFARKAKSFASSTDNTSDNTLLSHLSAGMKSAVAILEGDD